MKYEPGLVDGARGIGLALTMGVSLALFCALVTSIGLIPAGVGVFTTPPLVLLMRAHANTRRRLARSWFGVEIPVPYRPRPKTDGGLIGRMQLLRWVMKDPATWRDLAWCLVDATAGFALGVLAFSLLLYFAFGLVLAAGVWRPISTHGDGMWFAFIHVTSEARAVEAAVLGAGLLLVGLAVNPKLMRAHALMTRSWLAPNHERELEMRVERLTETRTDAVDTSAAELRRIERDLHDGAQARLVAMGMNLGAVEALMERDPEQAKVLLAQARQSSASALEELRDLVRGIHPPVLAERGLGDAVRALALRSPIPAEVTVDLPGRPDAPVESAAYFAVSEALTNAAKHSGAQRIWVDLRYEDGALRIMATDDGVGGATMEPEEPAGAGEPQRGSGLRGIERRLGTFDGVLALSSPQGGPTIVTMELPCALSWPKTSSS